MPTISVAVITFNGEKYVREQLESIKAQSLTPQQVLIFDDCSSDKTVEIISEFIKTNNLSHWKLFKQISNVGWRQNIFEVLMQCDTDIIFWSDQDDVWDNNKIEILTSLITDTDDNCMAAYSSWRYIDSFGNLLENFSGKNKIELILIDKYSPKMNIPPLLGCSACPSLREFLSLLWRVESNRFIWRRSLLVQFCCIILSIALFIVILLKGYRCVW